MSQPCKAALDAAERIYANRMSGKREFAKELFAVEIQKAIDSERKPKTIAELTAELRLWFPQLSDSQRFEVFCAIMDGHCTECGKPGPCSCWNDE